MSSNKTILVTGATGKQGGALISGLAGKGFRLRAMTRHPDGEAAQKLRAAGVEIVGGDLNDAASLERALAANLLSRAQAHHARQPNEPDRIVDV